MIQDKPSSSLPAIAGVLLVAGIGGVIVYQQLASTDPPSVTPRPSPAETVIAAKPVLVSSATPTAVARPAVNLVSSAREPAGTPSKIDWESLVERAPGTVLRQLEQAVPTDDSEARRFSVYEIRALAKLQRLGEAHAKAEAYFERWPSGPDVVFLQSLTGAHPKR